MAIVIGRPKGITIQIREEGQPSKCLTVHGMNANDVYNHVYFVFKALNDSTDETILTMYKKPWRTEINTPNEGGKP